MFLTVGMMSAPARSAEISEAQIAQAKAALNLTPAQARHWPRVAAALRAVSRQAVRAAAADEDGFVHKVRSRAASISSQAAGARRVLSAAMPLIRTLSPEQKQTARAMAQSFGFGHLASRL
jgi:hypothetical protein